MIVTCAQCGKTAEDHGPVKGKKKFCSDKCRMAAHLDRQFLERITGMDEAQLRATVRQAWADKPKARVHIRYGGGQ